MLNKNSRKVIKNIASFVLFFFFLPAFFPLTNSVQATSTSDLSITTISLLKFNPENWKAPTIDVDVILSKDGRYAIFTSSNSNLVPNDTNGFSDVFLYDRETDGIELISVAYDGAQGNGNSYLSGKNPISADGRFVVYVSAASNLVPNDTNGFAEFTDVFVYDRETKTVERTNVSSNGVQEEKFDSDYPPINGNPGVGSSDGKKVSISADGRFVAFESYARNLAEPFAYNVSPIYKQIFLRDRISHETVNLTPLTSGSLIDMSANGQLILLGSRVNLVSKDVNNANDIYLYDVLNHTFELVSVGSGGIVGQAPDSPAAFFATMSDDGRYIAFDSYATNFDPQQSMYSRQHIFVYDRELNLTRPLTSNENNHSSRPMISPDGRHVVFMSWATNLVDTQTNGQMEVYIYDLQTGQIKLISASINGIPGNGWNYNSQLYVNDGLFVLLNSQSTNLVPNDMDSYKDWYIVEVSNYVNQSPTANAGTDQTAIVAQQVVFDGFLSTDPDGFTDIVNFEWNFEDGNTGSGQIITHTFLNPGVYTVTLTVRDSSGKFHTDSAIITVITSSQAVSNLINQVETFNLQQGINNSLDAKLEAALNVLDDLNVNNNQAAINSLQAFINAVIAQRGDKITNTQADSLVSAAQTILAGLN